MKSQVKNSKKSPNESQLSDNEPLTADNIKSKLKDTRRKRHKEFMKLQNEWYKKLKDSGFDDIEWQRSDTGYEEYSPFLKGFQSYIDRPDFIATQNWYLLVQNYLTHAPLHPKIEKIVLELYATGLSYRNISKKINYGYTKRWKLRSYDMKTKKSHNTNLSMIYNIMQKHIKNIIEWNKTHPEGRLNEANLDFEATEVLINDDSFSKIRQ